MSTFSTKRLNILSESEITSLYSRPLIQSSEQAEYFTLPENAQDTISNFTDNTKVCFILQWGYFRASHQFHDINIDEMQPDIKFIINYYFDNKIKFSNFKLPSRPTHTSIRKIILNQFGYIMVGNV